jgi:acetylornithine/succinyldiaminopimelate/putrescine aminotransferase
MITAKEETISTFEKVTSHTLEHVRQRVKDKKPVFLSSLTPMFPETVQVAFLLNEIYHTLNGKKKVYKTFFCNSGIEALHGAIKIARHVSSLVNSRAQGQILIYDPSGKLSVHFDPLENGVDNGLVPGLSFRNEILDIEREIRSENKWAGILLSVDPAMSMEAVNHIAEECANKRIVFIVDVSRTSLSSALYFMKALNRKAAIFVWGEALTDYQIPFGAFSTAETIFPWDALDTCMLHSTTYGGNTMALSFVKEILVRSPEINFGKKQMMQVNDFEKHHLTKIQGFKKYINKKSPVLYNSGKLDINIIASEGVKLRVKNGRGKTEDILDCVGGSGCNLRGHNQQDIIADVLNTHDPEHDYWTDLSQKLKDITGFNRSFPGVSGASAVEMGIVLAMAANKDKKKIIVFRGNYAGTSLVAMNVSDRYNVPFFPLYPEVEFINFYEPRAKEKLLLLLNQQNVALVWFEAIQGGSMLAVPFDIIRMLNEHKEKNGYFIGIDEILNGTYRTGSFFSFDTKLISPDIVTLSKAISDMVFPMSVAMTSEVVYQRASLNYPELVLKLEKYYLNQLGSQIALHALEKVCAGAVGENVKKASVIIKSGLKNTIRESALLKSVDGPGLHLQLTLALDQFPFKYLGKQLSEMVMTQLCYQEGKVLIFFGRLLPPLTITELEAHQIAEGIDRAFKKSKIKIGMIGFLQKIRTIISAKTSALKRSMEHI